MTTIYVTVPLAAVPDHSLAIFHPGMPAATIGEWQAAGVREINGRATRVDPNTIVHLALPDEADAMAYLLSGGFTILGMETIDNG